MLTKKIPDTRGLVTTTVLNTKISQVENKIPDNSSLVVTTVLDSRISELGNNIFVYVKFITTKEFNQSRLTQANLLSKTDFDNKLISFSRKLPQIRLSI